jgi:hypothetical protein
MIFPSRASGQSTTTSGSIVLLCHLPTRVATEDEAGRTSFRRSAVDL